jgi:hypothetical protein
MSGAAGGAATAGGVAYQARVAAWAAARILAEERAAGLWGLEFPPGGGHRGYAAMVDGSGLMLAC